MPTDGPHLLDPDDGGVAGDRDEARPGPLQGDGVRDERGLGALPAAEEEGRPIRDAPVLPHEEVDVVLVADGIRQLDDPGEEVHGGRRTQPTEHADRLVALCALRRTGHRATKCSRNLRTWLTWYATL